MKVIRFVRVKIAGWIMLNLLDDAGIGYVITEYMEKKKMSRYFSKVFDSKGEWHVNAERIK